MPSWRYNPYERDEGYDCAQRYEADVRRAEELRLERFGAHSAMGWRRPVDPPCPQHGYGLVGGVCGVCLQEASLSGRADADRGGVPAAFQAGGNDRSLLHRGDPAARPESDEREAA